MSTEQATYDCPVPGNQDPEQANKMLKIGNGTMIVFYSILFSAAMHNTIKFVVKDSRGKNFHITYFYVMVYLIILVRVTWLSMMLHEVVNFDLSYA